MAFSHGKDSTFTIDNSGGTPVDITAYIISVDFPISADTAEVSTMGDSSKEYIAGLKDATISVEGKWDSTVDNTLYGIIGLTGTFSYVPFSGVTYSGECIMTSYNVNADIGDAVSFSAEFQVTGNVSRA
jgi:hypothetical protein